MNHIQFQACIGGLQGTIHVGWNSRGRLTQLSWKKQHSGLLEHSPELPLGSWSVLSRHEIPDVLHDLIARIRSYLSSGEPIGEPPWECIENDDWTEFQRKVYRAIAEIPHGETRTYAWVARRIRQISASRAVGQALKKNPFPILIPCHRIVAHATLGGFMGITDPNQPEMQLKRCLIRIEEEYRNPVFSFFAKPAVDFPTSGALAS